MSTLQKGVFVDPDWLQASKTQSIIKPELYGEEILPILKDMPKATVYFPFGGFLDTFQFRASFELDCIEMELEPDELMIVKPKKLTVENFDDCKWNYYRLETDIIIPYYPGNQMYEYLIEHEPCLVNRLAIRVEVGKRVLTRVFSGTFVFFSLNSSYELLQCFMPRLQVEMGELEFRLCIEKAKEQFDKMRNDKLL